MIVQRTIQKTLVVCLVFIATCASTAMALRDEKVLQIKAAFLLNFVKFTNWPSEAFESKTSPIVVVVLGDDPFGPVLEQTFAGRYVHGRDIELLRRNLPRRKDYRSDKAFQQVVDKLFRTLNVCHLAYINVDKEHRRAVLDRLDSKYLMTVGHEKRYAREGTTLALDNADGKIVFFANIQAIEQTELKVSSKLLRLARVVESDESEDG